MTLNNRAKIANSILGEKAELKNGYIKSATQCVANIVRGTPRYNDREQLIERYLKALDKASVDDMFNFFVILYTAKKSVARDSQDGELFFHLHRAETFRMRGSMKLFEAELEEARRHI